MTSQRMILDLPAELFRFVLEYCSFEDALNMRLVCPWLQSRVDKSELFNTKLVFKIDNPSQIMQMHIEWGAVVAVRKKLDFDCFSTKKVIQNTVAFWLSRVWRVECQMWEPLEGPLFMEMPRSNFLYKVISVLRRDEANLKELYVEWTIPISNIRQLSEIQKEIDLAGDRWADLNIELSFHDSKTRGVKPSFGLGPQFKSLNFDGFATGAKMARLLKLSNVGTMKNITFKNVRHLNIEDVGVLVSNCSTLENLIFIDTVVDFKNAPTGLENKWLHSGVKSLELRNCSYENYEPKKKYGNCPIESLTVTKCDDIEPIQLFNFPQLRHLSVYLKEETKRVTFLLTTLKSFSLQTSDWDTLKMLSSEPAQSLQKLQLDILTDKVEPKDFSNPALDNVKKLKYLESLELSMYADSNTENMKITPETPTREAIEALVKDLTTTNSKLKTVNIGLNPSQELTPAYANCRTKLALENGELVEQPGPIFPPIQKTYRMTLADFNFEGYERSISARRSADGPEATPKNGSA